MIPELLKNLYIMKYAGQQDRQRRASGSSKGLNRRRPIIAVMKARMY
jgi:hypothetical protein